MEDERYKEWDALFSNQREFKEELKQWLRKYKEDVQRYCKEKAIECEHHSAYKMLSELMGVSISSINNWMSLSAEKQIPEERIEQIRQIQAEVSHLASMPAAAPGEQIAAEESREDFVQRLKDRLSYEAVGRFYMEAEKAGMTLDAYLLSLLK